MALVSPGLQITVTDQSQYVSAAVGTVPLLILATAQDKTINGSIASGTTKANAGKLQVFGSQRELATALGYPIFKQSAAGTPLHGNELNEYGLMAAYSALGLGNRLYAVRADINLDELTATTVRPNGTVADGTYWLDLANTSWGIFEWSAATQTFARKTPIIITSTADVTTSTFNAVGGILVDEPTPRQNIGVVGSYAVVATTANNRVFYKKYDNTWVLVGSKEWQTAWPVATGTIADPTLTGTSIVINGVEVAFGGSTVSGLVDAINSANIPGVTAYNSNGLIQIFGTSDSSSTDTTADGIVSISSGTLVTQLGLTAGNYNTIATEYGTYASIPPWYTIDATATPSGSVWFKTGKLGSGSDFAFKRYSSLTDVWTTQSSVAYNNEASAIDGLDIAGGNNIAAGTIYLEEDPNQLGTDVLGASGFRPFIRRVYGAVTTTGKIANPTLTNGDTFTLSATQPGQSVLTTKTGIEVNGTNAAAFVAAILGANIPNVSSVVNANGTISITHIAGGTIYIVREAGQADFAGDAGFGAINGVYPDNVRVVGSETILSGFAPLTYTYSTTVPYANPESGTLWYNSDATTVDIMINDGTSWRGYKNLPASIDARGYDLTQTDPMGVIVSASAPVTQSDNSALAAGDLWLDTSDLENWPKLSRYSGTKWVAIDNTDQISQNGIVFADARWDITGTTDPVRDTEVTTEAMLSSDYIDLDAPDARLYPRGMLLFNTRRSGYNVKRYVTDYFNTDSFTVNAWAAGSYNTGAKVVYGVDIYVAKETILLGDPNPVDPSNTKWELLETRAWVTSSGLKNNGAMYAGHQAQRRMVVAAMQSAITANTQIREEQFNFSLIAAPGYPELIDDMVSLNNDRANTAFVIGDTPMTLSTNVVDLTNWSNNSNGDGLATADPYLAVYYPSGLSSDVQGNEIMVPPSHMALRTYIYNDNVSYQWFAPAGTRRGLVDNATDLGYLSTITGEFIRTGVNQGLRDSLYDIKINPITIMPGTGLVVWGQKTRNAYTSAMDRVNVARLINYIRTILASTGNGYLFEPNDKITRDQLKQSIEGALNDLVAKRGVYDYLVVCDTSNNTPDRIARNELYVDIAISPMRDVEFIYIPIRLVNPGAVTGLGK